MTKFEAVFEILLTFSAIDGDVDERELEVIFDFLNINEDSIDFNPEEVVENFDLLNFDGKVREFQKAALFFNDVSTPKDKKIVLDFVVDLIMADGVIDDNEKDLFHMLCNIFGIDVSRYLAQRG